MKKQRPVYRLIAMGAIFLAAAAGLFVVSHFLDRRINEKAIAADGSASKYQQEYSYKRGTLELYDQYYDYFHNFENFLIMGTDAASGLVDEDGDYHNDMADFLLLMSIDKTDNSFSLLELNRDTITDVPMDAETGDRELTAEEQLCIAHWYGETPEQGNQNQVRAVSMLLGDLPIAGYYSLNMEDIPKLNHAIGGVTVTMEDDFSKLDPEMKKGATLKLSDEQAYLYLRSRMSVGRGTNVERMARQHTYLTGFLDQSMQKLSAQPQYYYQLFETLTDIAQTDLTGKQISRIAKALTENTRKGQFQFEGKNKIGDTLGDGDMHMEFYPDEASVVETLTEIFQLKAGDTASDWNREEWLRAWKEFDWRAQAEEESLSENDYEDYDDDEEDDDDDEDEYDEDYFDEDDL